MSFKEKRNRHLIRQRTKSKEDKRVKFPQDIVFNEMVKDGDSSEIINFLRRESVDVDVNQRNEHGMTALKDLIMKDNLKCVKVLVNQGADVNGKDANGQTPLHYACQKGCLEIVKFLLESNADPEITDKYGLSPVDYVDDFEAIEIIMQYSKIHT